MREARQALAAFDKITAAGITLAKPLAAGVDQLRRVEAIAANHIPGSLLGLSDAEMYDAMVATHIHGQGIGRLLGQRLARELLAQLDESTDDLLDQIRPAFDEAAAQVHAATVLGINPRTTDGDILQAENLQEVADAWRGLVGQTNTLQALCEVRLTIAHTLHPERVATRRATTQLDAAQEAWEGSFFQVTGAPYTASPNELVWQRWVRLCSGSPARLVTRERASETDRDATRRVEAEQAAKREQNSAAVAHLAKMSAGDLAAPDIGSNESYPVDKG